jgi:2-octaprenyl-6-methoxyphenol hydroxylase
VCALSDSAFITEAQRRFGHRLGRWLKVGQRSRYCVAMSTAGSFTAERAVVMGNAAHSLHPVAGQGFNLAMRDVAALAEVLHDAVVRDEDPGEASVLMRYRGMRQRDFRRTASFTDLLVKLFSNGLPGAGTARGLGLVAMELWPAGKRHFIRYAMGSVGPLPRLARGLPLVAG